MYKIRRAVSEDGGSNIFAMEDIKAGDFVVVNKPKPEEMPDKGHLNLISDLSLLLKEAINFAFHDFKNEKYATPKVELVSRFKMLTEAVMNGNYDN